MKHHFLILLSFALCGCRGGNDFSRFPFMQMLPEATPQDNFELEQRLGCPI